MSKEEFLKTQTCVLKVNIHCDGCKDKVKKILQKIDGVYTTKIDGENGKVTVSGNIEPSKLIKKLVKNGKHAELWGASKGGQNHPQPHNLLKNLQIDNGKGGNNKGKGGGGQNQQQSKGGQNLAQMKGFQDLKMMMPFMGNKGGGGEGGKAVKFDLPPEDDGIMSDGEYSDDFDFDDDYSDEDDDGTPMDAAHLNRMKPLMGNGGGLPQMPNLLMSQNMMNNAKKGGGENIPPHMNLGGGGGKKGANGNANTGGNQNQAGKNGGGNNLSNPNVAKKGMVMPNMMPTPINNAGKNPAMGQFNNPAALQGLPVGGGAGNPYQQQQLAAMMMMNQQRANGNETFQPMMYARPPPAVNYMPPPYSPYPYPPPMGTRIDDYSMFSDENTSSCTIM